MVAWLEDQAAAALDRAEAAAARSGGGRARFAHDECVPLGTLRALGRPGTGSLVTELDPDASTRQVCLVTVDVDCPHGARARW